MGRAQLTRRRLAGGLALLLGTGLGGGQGAAEPIVAPVARFCVDPDWAPFEVIAADGTHQGIAADLLRLAAQRAGIQLRLVPTKDWDGSIAAAKRADCDLLSFLNKTPERETWLVFTDPLFTDPNVIITREEHPFIADLAALSDRTVALPSGTSIEERVRHDFPNLRIVITKDEAEAFQMVSDRKADLTIRSMTVAVYTIKKEGWFNLKISGQVPGYENRLRVGVRRDRVDLRDRLDRGIATITAEERERVANQHVSINVQTAIDYTLVRNLTAGFSLVLLTSLVWAMKLRAVNARLRLISTTDRLTGLANRGALDERLVAEIARTRRHRRPFAVILVDIDHFKTVNDDLGHLMGDQVLVEFAGLLRKQTRAGDLVGRWGGEEFLILCPETTPAQALVLANRLIAAVRAHAFATGRAHTISIGVAGLGDEPATGSGDPEGPEQEREALLRGADLALYRAKNAGRDRAIVEHDTPDPQPTA